MTKSLLAARKAKNDEFYTQLSDIEKELSHYTQHFRGKIVYCNCDDPRVSNFFHYFSHNFKHLGLKKLVTTCYKNQTPDLFTRHDCERAIMLEYDGFRDGDVVPRVEDIGVKKLDGDGDFRSRECINIMETVDVIVTNPPFSMFREYVSYLTKYEKKFLIIGSQNAITYKEIFPLIRDNKLWLGITPKGQDMLFDIPPDYACELASTKKEGSAYRVVDGVIKGRLGNAAWFTNLDHTKRHENLILYRKYTPDRYPRYDNYDAIEVGMTSEIPMDYVGVMGVPITFLNKYNPDQFELLGATESEGKGFSKGLWSSESGMKQAVVGGKRVFKRLFIRNRSPSP